jgi:hypothetical protein
MTSGASNQRLRRPNSVSSRFELLPETSLSSGPFGIIGNRRAATDTAPARLPGRLPSLVAEITAGTIAVKATMMPPPAAAKRLRLALGSVYRLAPG